MKLRVLSEADCRALLGMREAIDVQAEAFRLLAAGRAVEGLRAVASSEDPPGVAIFNPCFLRGGAGYGVKVISDFYGNSARGAPRMSGLIALFDGQTGIPRTVMEAGYVTDLRTGAGTALAARHLARKESAVLAVIGAGRVARNQVEGLASCLQLKAIRVSSRSRDRALRFMEQLRSCVSVPEIVFEESPAKAVRSADVVVIATTSKEPVLRGAWLEPGTFVAATGAYAPNNREVDSETVRRAALRVIDSRADVLDRAGDYLHPIREGILARDDVVDLARIVDGTRPGRRRAEDIVLYKSSGVPIQDLVTAQHIERRAIERNLGALLEMGGDHD